jgi:Tfp pilus assembly protein PilX
MLRTFVTVAVMAAALFGSPLAAQEQAATAADEAAEAETRSAEEMIEAAREALRPPSVRRRIVVAEPGAIVVTAGDPEAQRLENSTAEDLAAVDAATARTPCAGCLEPSGAGVRIGFGQPPPPALIIDLKAIPEAPPGSDAARYAEAP